MEIKQSILYLENIHLKPYQIHQFRGFIGNLFAEHDLIHNHNPVSGRIIYRYPLIQFKLIDHKPVIIAITDQAVTIFHELFMSLDHIVIAGKYLPIYEKDLKIERVRLGYTQQILDYAFESPWIALNQTNHKRYLRSGSREAKQNILKQALTGNILSMAKYLNHWLGATERIQVQMDRWHERRVTLKGHTLFGFTGGFKVNFLIPDYLGLGKSVSRGFGTVRRAPTSKAKISKADMID